LVRAASTKSTATLAEESVDRSRKNEWMTCN